MPVFKKIIKTSLLVCAGLLLSFQNSSFKATQLRNSRVKTAYSKHWKDLQTLLDDKKLDKASFSVYLRVFKADSLLEVWAKDKSTSTYTFLKNYRICASSGNVGPKRRQGDGQVPEGFYEIAAFQPQSNYHLALKVGYPNKSDRLKATASDPGGDIMIHGNCVTIGCIPIQDEPIEELYILCVETKDHGFPVLTDIYPFKFKSQKAARWRKNADPELSAFWNNLELASDYFDLHKKQAKVSITAKGDYHIHTD